MDARVEQAVMDNRMGTACSTSVLKAFASDADLSEREASRIASPMAGGAMGTCGAVLAAEYVLQRKGMKAGLVEEAFAKTVGSSECQTIRRNRLRSCNGCVEEAAKLLAEALS